MEHNSSQSIAGIVWVTYFVFYGNSFEKLWGFDDVQKVLREL